MTPRPRLFSSLFGFGILFTAAFTDSHFNKYEIVCVLLVNKYLVSKSQTVPLIGTQDIQVSGFQHQQTNGMAQCLENSSEVEELLDCLRICNYISLQNYTLCNFKQLKRDACRNRSRICMSEHAYNDDCRYQEA